jgi:phosphoserine aminotransferase
MEGKFSAVPGRFQTVGDYAHRSEDLAIAISESMSDAEEILKNPKSYAERD